MQESSQILLAGEEVRSNYHKTIFLLCTIIACIFGLSWLLGEILNNVILGIKIGFLVCLIVIPLELMAAKFTIVSLTGCVPLDLNNPAEARLLKIVQGISISAGLSKVPDVYLIETNIPNAFAAGWNEDSAFIGITAGLADILDDQELSGVIAHEISHIIHRDIMVCQLSIALNTAMLVLAVIVRWVSFLAALVKSRNIFVSLLFWLLFLCIYPITAFVGLLFFMAISRKREYAADAMAVRLCSYNEGLARALEKIQKLCPKLNNEEIEILGGKKADCLYFHFPTGSLFSTHPDINERIRRLRSMY